MSQKIQKYCFEHSDTPEQGQHLTIICELPDPTQFYYMKTYAEVEFPIVARRYCVYHLQISHFDEAPKLNQLQLFTQLKHAQLYSRQQFKLTMGHFPKIKGVNTKNQLEWQEESVMMDPNMKSEVTLAEDCHNYLVIISRSHIESHSLSSSSLWE